MGGWEIILILAVILVLLGAGRLGDLRRLAENRSVEERLFLASCLILIVLVGSFLLLFFSH